LFLVEHRQAASRVVVAITPTSRATPRDARPSIPAPWARRPARRYERRRPEKTPLHEIVSENLESWLAWRQAAERPVPGHVEEELRGYLECGILCFGFARALCTGCGQGFVVAFSCKGRGVCPSCNGRHMAQTAAHLVDHVIPPVAVRQWVISVPKRFRGMLADRPHSVAALTKIFLDEIERTLLTASGVTPSADTLSASRPRLGGISFLHRFGSALNHHVHLHACVTDGAFVPAAEGAGCDTPPAFVPAPPITPADLAVLTERVRRRVIRWFRLTRLLDAAAAADILAWENSGFSIDAHAKVHAARGHRRRRALTVRFSRTARRSRPTAAEAPAPISRSIRGESQAQAGRHGARHREHWQAGRRRDRRAWGRRSRRGRLL
jgi:hypothetical protein